MKQDSLQKFVTLHRSLLAEKARLESRLSAINQALNNSPKAAGHRRKGFRMSAAARRKISEAAKARWARIKAGKK